MIARQRLGMIEGRSFKASEVANLSSVQRDGGYGSNASAEQEDSQGDPTVHGLRLPHSSSWAEVLSALKNTMARG
jgi:hypothetical protein